jgi:hypothetical protein
MKPGAPGTSSRESRGGVPSAAPDTGPLGLGGRLALALCLAAALAATAVAQPAPARLTFAQLAEAVRANAAVTEGIKAFAGKEIEIQGFIIPAGPPDLSFFLLSRVSATGNYCCELPSGQDETVYVYAGAGVSLRYDPLRVYRVRGVFEAGHVVDPVHGVSLFRVRGARVEEAAGARIFKIGEPGPPAEPRPTR